MIVGNPKAGPFLLPADFPGARFCHLPDPSPVGRRVAQSVSAIHSIVLWYARPEIYSGRLKEVAPSQACDFLIPPHRKGSA